MPLISMMRALELVPDATDEEIAARLRTLTLLDPVSRHPYLWVRVLDGLSLYLAFSLEEQISDMGDLAWQTAEMSLIGGDARYDEAHWREELAGVSLGTDTSHVLSWLAGAVADRIAPPLAAAGLTRAQPVMPAD